MRLSSSLALLATSLTLLAAAPAAHGASLGLVIPGDLQTNNPLITRTTELGRQGAKTAKFFVTWNVIAGGAGGSTVNDAKIVQYADTVKHLRANGISSTIVFFGGEPELPAATRDRTPPTDNGRFAAVMGAFAAKMKEFGAGGTTMTVWNEADEGVFWAGGANPDKYVDLLKRSYESIKRADDTVRVGITPLTAGNWRFLQAAYERGAKGFFDAVPVDVDTACNIASPYSYYRDQQDGSKLGQITFLGYREVRKTQLANGDPKPILLEIGWSTAIGDTNCNQGLEAGKKPGGVTEAQQAQFLREAVNCLSQDDYVETAYWFELQDRGTDRTHPDENFGLIDPAGRNKPAHDAFVAAAGGANVLAGQECGDFRAPDLTVISPVEGQQYTDRFDIRAKASDAAGVGRITFQYDGANEIRNFTGGDVGNDKIVGLEPWFKSRELAIGKHTVKVIAIDAFGNTAEKVINVEKVPEGAIAANLQAVFKIGRKVSCKRRVCSFRVSLGKAANGPSVSGKVLAQWQWYSPPKPKKKGKRKKAIPGQWKTIHKATKPANKVFTLKQKVSRKGKWRLRLTHQASAPYKTYSAKDIPFTIK